ncbi:MAG TPA: hypothetical protein VFR86_06955 [Burkholderiaceae bacterium]|nr:hypothetical protein [Burkholderiaceae bacterium]
MPATLSLREIQDTYARLERVVPGFAARSSQLAMIEAVVGALAQHYTPTEELRTGRSFAVIEAPTGVGKSMGYALPGIVAARRLGKKLLISSSTVALQSQIAN